MSWFNPRGMSGPSMGPRGFLPGSSPRMGPDSLGPRPRGPPFRPGGGWGGGPPRPPMWGAPDISSMEIWGCHSERPRLPFHGKRGRGREQIGGPLKRPRMDKRELPINNQFFCETCDRGFRTQEKYKEHTDGHMKCSHEGCPYTACPKLVQNHIQQQHRNGMAKKIWQLESKEDIAKWIQERKKNFPTKKNIEIKKQIHAEKVARGEVLETKSFSKMRGSRRERGRGRGRGRGNSRQQRGGGRNHRDHTDVDSSKPAAPTPTLKSVRMNSSLAIDPLAYFNQGSEDSDGDEKAAIPQKNEVQETPVKPALLPNSLALISSVYTDSEDSEAPADVNTSPPKTVVPVVEESTVDTIPKQEEKVSSTQPPADQSNESSNKDKAWEEEPESETIKKQKEIVQMELKKKAARPKTEILRVNRKSSLLEKLLANEIRHERNVLLQCVHYVVNQNFFMPKCNNNSSNVREFNNTEDGLCNSKKDNCDSKAPLTTIIDEEVWEAGLIP